MPRRIAGAASLPNGRGASVAAPPPPLMPTALPAFIRRSPLHRRASPSQDAGLCSGGVKVKLIWTFTRRSCDEVTRFGGEARNRERLLLPPSPPSSQMQ